MDQLIDYLIKLSGTLVVMYLFYWLVLRRLTFYNSNRWYLLGYSIIAFVIPFINVDPLLRSARLENDQFVKLIPVFSAHGFDTVNPLQVSNPVWDMRAIGFTLFAAGIVVMLIRFIIQYVSVWSVRNASQLISSGHVNVYHIDKNIVPFSFGNSIFINKYKHTENELENIIRHEFIHVIQKHTIDIVWSECLCILNWYNPFAWLIRKAIRENLEFIADSKVLKNGIDKKQYQYLLLKVVGAHQNGIATNFNFTSLKTRIAMMNKMRSAKLHIIKFLFVLPLLAVILLAFRNTVHTQTIGSETISSAFIVNDDPSTGQLIVDTVPGPKIVKVRPPSVVRPNNKGYIITVADNHGECIVLVRDKTQKIVKALTLVEWNERETEYRGIYGDIPPPAPEPPPPPSAPPVPEAPIMPENIASIHVKDKKLTVVTKTGDTEVYDLTRPDQKESFQKKYGTVLPSPRNPQSAPNPQNQPHAPAIIIDKKESKPSSWSTEQNQMDSTLEVKIRKPDLFKVENEVMAKIKTPEDFHGLFIVDDKEYDKNSFDTEVKLQANLIKYVEVYKNEKAMQLYGEKGKNGVIRIVTKRNND